MHLREKQAYKQHTDFQGLKSISTWGSSKLAYKMHKHARTVVQYSVYSSFKTPVTLLTHVVTQDEFTP